MNKNLQAQTEINEQRTTTYYIGVIITILAVILFILHFYKVNSDFNKSFNNFSHIGVSEEVTNEIRQLQEKGLHEEAEKLIHKSIQSPFDNKPINHSTAPIFPFIFFFLGFFLMIIGRQGLYGSGVLLNPTKEADDLEPINRGLGKQLGHILNAAGISKNNKDQTVKVRCTSCKYLNNEEDKFCGGCGKEI